MTRVAEYKPIHTIYYAGFDARIHLCSRRQGDPDAQCSIEVRMLNVARPHREAIEAAL